MKVRVTNRTDFPVSFDPGKDVTDRKMLGKRSSTIIEVSNDRELIALAKSNPKCTLRKVI